MAFAVLTFAISAEQEVTRCGWLSGTVTGMKLVDADGTYLISTTGPGMFTDLSNGLIHVPEIHIQSKYSGYDVQTFCGCVRMVAISNATWIFPLAQIKHFENLNLEKCFKDPKLPSLNRALD